MAALAKNVVTPVWALLVAATVVSWLLGADHGVEQHEVATTVIMTTSFAKTWFVGMYFMELRHAPPALKHLFQAWVGVFCVLVLAIYFLA